MITEEGKKIYRIAFDFQGHRQGLMAFLNSTRAQVKSKTKIYRMLDNDLICNCGLSIWLEEAILHFEGEVGAGEIASLRKIDRPNVWAAAMERDKVSRLNSKQCIRAGEQTNETIRSWACEMIWLIEDSLPLIKASRKLWLTQRATKAHRAWKKLSELLKEELVT